MRDGRDAEMIAAWRRGDPLAAREVIALHGPAMLRVALALCPRVEDAEEIVQDALLRAYRALGSFDPARGDLRAWLVGVTANRARQVRRGLARYASLLARLGRESVLAAVAPAPRTDLESARRKLAELPPREREAFVLVEIEELTSIQAARSMGISDSTVRVLVTRARARLQRRAPVTNPAAAHAEGRER